MSFLSALDTLHEVELIFIVSTSPNFETSCLFMSDKITSVASHDVFLCALSRNMTYFIALETRFLVAAKGVMSVLATKDAVWHLPRISAISSNMTIFKTVSAFDGWIVLNEISSSLIFQLSKGVIFFRIILKFNS